MPNYSGLTPMWANYLAGQDQTNSIMDSQQKRQELAQLIQARQQEAAHKAQLQPFELEKAGLVNTGLGLGNQTKSAELPGVVADSNLKRVNADTAQRTQQSNIDTTFSNNEATQDENKIKVMNNARTMLMDAAAQIEDVPEMFRASAFRQLIEGRVNPDHPLTQRFLEAAQKDPKNFPKFVSKYADRLGAQAEAMSPAARSAKTVANISADASRYHADKSAGATVRAAQIGADSRMEVQRMKIDDKLKTADNVLKDLKAGKIPPDRALIAAKTNLMDASTEAEREKWMEIGAFAENALRNKSQYSHEGDPTLGSNGQGGLALTPKTVPPLFPTNKPAAGTADDPIRLRD